MNALFAFGMCLLLCRRQSIRKSLPRKGLFFLDDSCDTGRRKLCVVHRSRVLK